MKKALLIGINRYAEYPLRGCLNDLTLVRRYLTRYFGFSQNSITELRDQQATKPKVMDCLNRMIGELKAGDLMAFHYSGHGSYVPDMNGDEDDKRDEVLCVYDMDWHDPIIDDDLYKVYGNTPVGATLIVTMDCCHSGTNYRVQQHCNRFLPPPGYDPNLRHTSRAPKVKIFYGEKFRTGNIICLSGCAADQTCADAMIDDDYYGAFTYYLAHTIRENNGNLKYAQLIDKMRRTLQQHDYTQVPELYVNDSDLQEQLVFR